MARERHLARAREDAHPRGMRRILGRRTNVVSLRLNSAASDCISASLMPVASGKTASGLPPNRVVVKTSTVTNGYDRILEDPIDLAVRREAICSAAGTRGRPGMLMISPAIATTKPAPADRRTSRIGSVCPVGAPRSSGSAAKLYCVLAIQTGSLP